MKSANQTRTFTTTGNLRYDFDTNGRLTSVKDLGTNALTLAYDASGRLATVTAPGPMTYTFTYNGSGRLSGVTGPASTAISYGYNASGDLVSATDAAGGVRQYTYSNHRLASVINKDNQTLFTNTFDATNRVITQTDAQNQTLTIAYDTPAKGATRLTDPSGGQTVYYFDRWHRTTDLTDPTARTTSFSYDADGNLFRLTDPGLNQWTVGYDGGGNVTGVTDPLNGTLQMTWNARHQPLTVRDKRGNVTTNVYDASGYLTSSTDSLATA